MDMQMFLMGVLPLVVFVIVDSFAGAKLGIMAAIVFGIGECAYEYIHFGEVDTLTIVATALIVATGLISIKMNNPRLFKFQPVMVGVIFAAFIAYYQIFDEPILVKMSAHLDPKMFPRPLEEMREWFRILSRDCIFVFLMHAGLVAYAAVRMSNWAWVIMKGVVIWFLLIGDMLIETLLHGPIG